MDSSSRYQAYDTRDEAIASLGAGTGRGMRFEKWQALGNDYVIVEQKDVPWELTEERIRRICSPHTGVGSDGILLLSPAADPEHVADLRIFNPDGSEAELSGNGAREAVLYLRRAGWTEQGRVHDRDGRRADHADAHLRADRDDRNGHAHPPSPRTSRRPRPTAAESWRRRAGSGASSTSRSAIRSARSTPAMRSSSWRSVRSAPRSKATSCSRTGPTSPSSGCSTGGFGPGSSSAGWGRRCPLGTGASGAAIAAFLAGGVSSPVKVQLDGGELDVEISDDLDVAPQRLGRAGLRRRAVA